MYRLTALLLTLFMLFIACSSEKAEQETANDQATAETSAADETESDVGLKIEYKMSGIPFDLDGKPVEIAGIRYTPASQWTDLGPSGMRKADYYFGPLENDTDSATMNIFYFGKDMGGSIDANLDRWINQMTLPDGRDPHTAVIRNLHQPDGMKAHIISLQGTYNAGSMMGGPSTPKNDYRLVGVVVEAPEGNVFFKLTGPEYTARIMIEAFITGIDEIKKIN